MRLSAYRTDNRPASRALCGPTANRNFANFQRMYNDNATYFRADSNHCRLQSLTAISHALVNAFSSRPDDCFPNCIIA